VAEVADVEDHVEQQLHDYGVARFEVQLVLRVVSPVGQKAHPAGYEQANREGDEDNRLDDPLDDDDLDEGVVLASHAAELGPQSRSVVRAF
jgi:hypothetical protein